MQGRPGEAPRKQVFQIHCEFNQGNHEVDGAQVLAISQSVAGNLELLKIKDSIQISTQSQRGPGLQVSLHGGVKSYVFSESILIKLQKSMHGWSLSDFEWVGELIEAQPAQIEKLEYRIVLEAASPKDEVTFLLQEGQFFSSKALAWRLRIFVKIFPTFKGAKDEERGPREQKVRGEGLDQKSVGVQSRPIQSFSEVNLLFREQPAPAGRNYAGLIADCGLLDLEGEVRVGLRGAKPQGSTPGAHSSFSKLW